MKDERHRSERTGGQEQVPFSSMLDARGSANPNSTSAVSGAAARRRQKRPLSARASSGEGPMRGLTHRKQKQLETHLDAMRTILEAHWANSKKKVDRASPSQQQQQPVPNAGGKSGNPLSALFSSASETNVASSIEQFRSVPPSGGGSGASGNPVKR